MSQVRQRRGAAEKRGMSPTPDYMPFFVDPEPVPKKKKSENLILHPFIPCIYTVTLDYCFPCRSIPPHESVCFIGLSHDRNKIRKENFVQQIIFTRREGGSDESERREAAAGCLFTTVLQCQVDDA